MTAGNDRRALVRPYTVTRGRTATAAAWPPETVIAAVDRPTAQRHAVPDTARGDLIQRVRGAVLLPGEPGFREEAGSTAAPRLVLCARDRDDVAAGLAVAAEHDLRVIVGGRAAAAGTVRDHDGMLITTGRMRDLAVDPARRSVRVGAGVTWSELSAATAHHGLVAPSGHAPELGVVDQALRGGLGPWARAIGFAADQVEGLELVTADGVGRWVDAVHEIELFWALRGGAGGSRPFGVVTAIELGLSPTTELYGGQLGFDGSDDVRGDVLAAYPDWSASLDEATTSVLSWRRDTHGLQLRITHAGPSADGEEAVAAMRARDPVVDTVAPMPASAPGSAERGTVPRSGWARGLLLRELHPDVLAVLAEAMADSPAAVEIHHLGGATALRPAVDDAVGGRHARYAIVLVDERAPDGGAPSRGSHLFGQLAPYAAGTATVTLADGGIDLAADPDGATRARLADLADRHDPAGRFRAGRPVTGRHRENVALLASSASDVPSLTSGNWGTSPTVTDDAPESDAGPEARAILRLARPWRSVAEIAGTLGLPLGVVRVLVADLDEAGLVTVHRPPAQDVTDHLERVLRGLRQRL